MQICFLLSSTQTHRAQHTLHCWLCVLVAALPMKTQQICMRAAILPPFLLPLHASLLLPLESSLISPLDDGYTTQGSIYLLSRHFPPASVLLLCLLPCLPFSFSTPTSLSAFMHHAWTHSFISQLPIPCMMLSNANGINISA